MKKISVKKILLFILVAFLAIITFRFWIQVSFPDQNWKLEKGEKMKIRTEIVQKFQADRDGLTRIKILFGNSNVSPGGIFNFKIYDESCQKIIREVFMEITSLNSNNTTDFVFPKIDNSKDQTFCLKLTYKQKKEGKKAQLFVIENQIEQSKFLSVNDEELPGQSLAMRPAYKNEYFWQDISELNKRMSQYKPWFLKHYFLYIVAFGFVILSILLVLILILL